jgi:hypothetical protein
MDERFRTGSIHGYTFLLEYASEHILVFKEDGMTFDLQGGQTVPGITDFVRKAKDLRLGWGEFPDGDEVIYLYDKGDENFGYALNLDAPQCSEWGYAPF